MQPNDYRMIDNMLLKKNALYDDLVFLKGFGKKMELEILMSKSEDFFVNYLVTKLDIQHEKLLS